MNKNNNNRRRRPSESTPEREQDMQQKAVIAQRRQIQQRQKKRKRQQMMEKIKAVMVFSLIGLIICLGAIIGYIYFDYNRGGNDDLPLKLTFGNEEAKRADEDNYFFRNGEYYISLTNLVADLGFTIHGNAKSTMTLTNPAGEDIATFIIGTNNVRCGSSRTLMTNPSYFENSRLFIPVSFFPSFFNGVHAEYNSKGGEKGYNLIFENGFSPKHITDNGTPVLSYDEILEHSAKAKPVFISSLEQYEMYMNPVNKDEYLFLINEAHPLSASYIPEDLCDVSDTRNDRQKQKMRLYAAKSLEAMFIEMRANGFTDVSVTSAYRSYEYQSQLFNSRVQALLPTYSEIEATAKVKTGTSLPGTSEHQSGLCADLHNLPAASEAFAAQDAYRWLYTNCAEFGFILRYPKNKTEITGIMFEPWHYRYVGRYHARKIMDSGVCLEEYIASLS